MDVASMRSASQQLEAIEMKRAQSLLQTEEAKDDYRNTMIEIKDKWASLAARADNVSTIFDT